MSIGKSNQQVPGESNPTLGPIDPAQASRSLKGLARRKREKRRVQDRRTLLEALEARHLMAGPNLIGIQPSADTLLVDGSVLNTAPRELVFRFDDNTAIDPDTLRGIQITRAGADQVFESARATSDVGTNGAALVEFRARQAGTAGEGLTVLFTSSQRVGGSAPLVSVAGRVVTVDFNSTPGTLPTTVRGLITAIENNQAANSLLQVFSVSGSTSTQISTPSIAGTQVVLRGANSADAVSDLGTNNAVRVRFLSSVTGAAGRGTQVILQRADAGGPANPLVLVSGNEVTVRINSNPGNETTVAQLLTAINTNPEASRIVNAILETGSAATVIGNRPGFARTLSLTGATDVLVEPGYVGIGNLPNEVVFRFAEALPDDSYQIDIFGAGVLALTNVDGEAFNNGVNDSRRFTLNLGPKVLAVVPEPVRRTATGLSPEVGVIEVHFSEQIIIPTTPVERQNFIRAFQLVYTADTVTPADDRIVYATRTGNVGNATLDEPTFTYDSTSNVLRLIFKDPLARMTLNGTQLTGAARLRIGTMQELQRAAPQLLPTADAGDSQDAARTLGDLAALPSDPTGTRAIRIQSDIRNATVYDLQLPGADAAGVRIIRPEDAGRLDRTVPLDFFRQGPDAVNGITTFSYDFPSSFRGDDPSSVGIDTNRSYFNLISEQQKQRVREVLSLFSQYLGVQFVEVPAGAAGGAFFSIAVGDLYGADEAVTSQPGGLALATRDRDLDGRDDLVVLDFQDFDQSTDDQFGGEFFRGAMFAVGQVLGYGYADSLPQPVTQSTAFVFNPSTNNEPAYPSVADIINGQYLYRPDSTDVDLYRFTLRDAARVSISTIAERLANSSLLDTHLRLYRQDGATGAFVEVAQNDDYFSNDSLLELDLTAGTYLVGVSATGNSTYDPVIPGTGFGGRSEGEYELRITTTLNTPSPIRDRTNVPLDGDADGSPGGVYDFWFVPADQSNTLYVDKAATTTGNGTIAQPFRNLNAAVSAATPGTTIRVLANGGTDGRLETLQDNFSYQIGFNDNGVALQDGTSLDLPRGVRLVIDAGAIFKLRASRVGVGSTAPLVNRSDAAIQVLGTPTIRDNNGLVARNSLGEIIPGSVIFTSFNDSSIGQGNITVSTRAPRPGDWGGIDLRGDVDAADTSRRNRELEGVFLNHIQFADLRYGGGQVSVDGRQVVVSPVDMAITRATIANSKISFSADAAISATPDTFRETRFDEGVFQQNGSFVPSAVRVGPEIRENLIVDSTINGLFVRVATRSGSVLQPLTTQARFDDTDIVHVLTENLVVRGTPGGPVSPAQAPSSLVVGSIALAGGGQVAPGTYVYRLSFASPTNESAASGNTVPVTVTTQGVVVLSQLPAVPAGSGFTQRRLYRAPVAADGTVGTFLKVADLNATDATFTDRAAAGTVALPDVANRLVARTDASLVIDPGTVVKLGGSRIDVTFGGNLIAEGTANDRIVFTSLKDRRYGAGGTFDTNSDTDDIAIAPGDWGGIYVGPGSSASFDRNVIAGAGGSTRIEGGFASFNAIEAHQAELRLANSRLELNADGVGFTNTNSPDRVGRGTNATASVFVRGSQPIIVNNDILNSNGPVLSFDVNSLVFQETVDQGRSTGRLDKVESRGNSGPLVRGNRLFNNSINGMEVRGGQVATEVVLDDTDIVHVVRDTIEVPNQHIYGGLRLQSDARGSLVVKFESSETETAGIVAGGSLTTAANQFVDIRDRIGGSLQVVGHPDFPVILTALSDDLAGAGFTPFGRPQLDTNNDGQGTDDDDDIDDEVGGGFVVLPTGPEVNNGLLIDNDVLQANPGFFESTIGSGNEIVTSGVTVQAQTGLLIDQDYVFQYSTFIRVGNTTTQLSQTTVTQAATLVAEDRVESRGTFNGPNGVVNWIATTYFLDGTPVAFSQLDMSSPAGALGNIQVISYLDEDVNSPSDDVLYTVGTPGQADFRLFTVDTPLRIGFSHGGFYQDGPGQTNATYAGWAADRFPVLRGAIANSTQTFSIPGVVNLASLPQGNDPVFGTVFGPADVTTAHAWTINPTAATARVTSFLELLSEDPTENAPPQQVLSGQWNGLVIREGASDRNVLGTSEREPDNGLVSDSNAIPAQSQFLGELAPNVQSGDENRRLGFVVDGVITRPSDMDVYSFLAQPGTQVWIDIDRTDLSLDSIVELIGSNGETFALSSSSLQESRGDFLPLVANGLEQSSARPLNTIPIAAGLAGSAYQDQYSTNPRDAGLRVVLPASAPSVGDSLLYHVRVRSSSIVPGGNRNELLTNFQGKTAGSYRLQIRLQEQDEVPGSQIRFADVRFATTGLQVIGQPLRNPLIADEYETSSPNETVATAQRLGLFDVNIDSTITAVAGPLASDRLAKSVGGILNGLTDVDWYSFDVNYQNLTRDGASLYLSTIFDIDYADGFARSDVAIYVFNGAGELILVGGDSNVADDQPTGLDGTNNTDLSRGSGGTRDPFIGAAELAEGNYFVAVVNQSQIPSVMTQFTIANAINPLLRLEPVDSVTRIAEDRIDSVGGGTASPPTVPLLFNGEASAIPYTLNDMVMYTINGSTIGMTNPFTGASYGAVGAVGSGFRDFAFLPNGEMFAYSTPSTAVNADLDLAYSYFRINSENGALTNLGLTGLETFHVVDPPPQLVNGVIVDPPPAVVDSNDGLTIEAMTFATNTLGFFVGNRPIDYSGAGGPLQNAYFQNILYGFNPQTGAVSGFGTPNRQVRQFGTVTIDERANGAGTQIRERGYIETGTGAGQAAVGNQLVVPAATRVAANGVTTSLLNDGNAFTIQIGGQQFRIELDAGPVLNFNTDAATGQFPIDGIVFSLTTPSGTQVYELDTGPVIVLDATQIVDGATITVQDSQGISRTFEFDSNNAVTTPNARPVPFTPFVLTPTTTPAQIAALNNALATSLATAVSSAGFGARGFATPGQGRVDLTGDSTTAVPTFSGAGIAISGTAGSLDPNIPGSNIIAVRENFTGDELASAVAAATGGAVAGNRVNFRNVTASNLTNLTVRNLVTQTGTSGVTTGTTGVRFFVSDTAEAVAIRIAQVVNGTAAIQAAGISATASNGIVTFQNAILNASNGTVDPAFRVGGVPPGGLVRGIATIGGTLYAVSDAGGLYVVSNPTATVEGQISNYVTTATDLIGLNFAGLSAGPQNLEGGRFANLLFGVTTQGDLYAFDTAGRLQPVFAGGATSVNVGAGTRGIDFSTLDFNLWHVTDRRSTDAGHGINAIHNGTRTAVPGGRSFYFGAEASDQDILGNLAQSPFAVARQDGQGVRNTYNFPGGAKGAIESNPFSLAGYAASDLPMLYFNYFLETDGVDSVVAGGSDQDAFRVYAITDDGVQHLLSTNNLATAPLSTFDDEFDDPTESANPLLAAIYDDEIDVNVQRTFDNTGAWRQARVGLSAFAGQQNLRLRVEFSTGASFGDGTLGLRALAGNRLVDGQTIEVGGRTFEIDLGTTLSIPSGAQIAGFYAQAGNNPASRVTAVVGGVTYVLNDGTRTVNPGEVNVLLQMQGDTPLSTFTAQTVATRLAAAIRTNGVPTNSTTFNFLTEPNDELISAVAMPPVVGNTSFTGLGRLESAIDVDLFKIDLPANSTLDVSMLPAGGSSFVGNVRLFDSNGRELVPGTSGQPSRFVTTSAQTVFIGFSSNSNSNYNPLVGGSGNAGVAGDYTATVTVTSDFRVIQNGSLLQITGGFAASGGSDGLVVATGTPGTVGIPVVVDASMTPNQVAIELQRAIARQFSSGITSAYPVFDATITLPGLTVTNAGPFGLDGVRSSDVFGSTGVARAQANNFEGIYIDDFIIGFAERGELVTGATGVSTFTADPSPTITNPAQPTTTTVTGAYQLEIRDASEYVNSATATQFRTFDTNDRLASGLTVQTLPAANIVDGTTFQLSDGVSTVTFEFDVELAPGVGNGVRAGNVRVGIPAGGRLPAGDDGSMAVARAMIAAINDPSVRSLIDVAAVPIDGVDSLGNARINLFGSISISGTNAFGAVTQADRRGDANRDRGAQGTIIVENSRFLFNSNAGIELTHDATALVAGQTTNTVVSYPANLIELNTERLIPGVVVQSNVLAFNEQAGIRISGLSASGSQSDPVPFERIVNNTIIGGAIEAATATVPGTFSGVLFPGGALSFADSVVSFTAGTGVSAGFTTQNTVLGAPDGTGRGVEPANGNTTLSLGSGGVVTVQFTDNLLTGSGDARPDLIIFETGEIESVRVAVSRDGVSFINVGVIGGIDTTIDLDAAGFGTQDRFAFVRLTDLRQGSLTSGPVGADIDAIGALSTVAVDRYTAGGSGIIVANNASPTLLNNVISNSEIGVNIDNTSLTSVLGANSYYRNTAATSGTPALPIGQFGQVIPATIDLFVDPVRLVFAPRAGVPIIDSSIDSLEDRSSLKTVRDAIGLAPSPIIAPRLDVNGQLRVDDPTVESPLGSGERVFKDRGAEDRADQSGPRVVLLSPRAEDLGLTSGQAETRGTVFDSFDIQIIDGIGPIDPVPGVGVDDRSVNANTILLSKDGVTLVEGVDYRFGYDPTNNIIRLTPIAGIWEDNSTYTIRLLDASDSVLRFVPGANQIDGAITTLLTTTGEFRNLEVEGGVRINVTPNAVQAGIDGQIISIFNGVFSLNFEIDTNATAALDSIPVNVLATATADQIAVALATAINGTALGLNARASGSQVQLFGPSTLTSAIPATQASTIFNVTGAIGTQLGFGIRIPTLGSGIAAAVQDGQTFSIRRGANLLRTFELDLGGNGIVTAGAIPIVTPANPSLTQLATAIVNAIGGAGLGLSPVNAGEGRIVLGGDANYALDLTNTALTQIGAAGDVASIPVIVPIDATAEQVAAAYAAAIQSAGFVGVTSSVVGDRVILSGVEAVSGANALSLPIIRDEVGNALQSNRPNGQTILTVFVGGGFDYGDAPAPYRSTLADGGPRHGIDRNLTLGQDVSPDADAALPDGDLDDGVALVGSAASGFPAVFSIEVNSADNRPFYVDAWIDWNRNNVFDATEVTRYRSPNAPGAGLPVLGSGINTVAINVPSGIGSGVTYARFRLSEVSGLGPNGDAATGEVEDLAILVQNNPYQNPLNTADVNKSGTVTPLDALNIINLLSRHTNPTAIPLNPPPAALTDIVNGRFLPDVDGNGLVTARDALLVINAISAQRRAASGEGEAFVPVADGVLASPLTVATSSVVTASSAQTEPSVTTVSATADEPAATSSTSVFDSASIVALDDILEDLATDPRTSTSTDTDTLDSVFAGLGSGL